MYRLLLFILIGGMLAVTGCKKDSGVYGPSQVKAQAAIDEKVIQDYMAANNLTGKFTKGINKPDSTGLWYMITKDTATATLYSSSSLITVGYTGRVLPSDNVFIQTDAIHPSFTLGQMIKGWNLCLPKCNKGGTIRILMASRYAYGPYAQENLGLPANSVLDFEITVYDVVN